MKQRKMYWAMARIAIVTCVIFSCEKEEQQINHSSPPLALEELDTLKQIKLGKKLENPYSVANMRRAWDSLKLKSKVSKEGEIETTHLYLRFIPKTEDELTLLKGDSTLVLYDIPLDFEITESGDFYHDPEIPEEQPTYQYASVLLGHTLPKDIEYELLEELFVPDEDFDTIASSESKFASKEVIYKLVDESLRLTGNLGTDEIKNPMAAKSKWRPAGVVGVFDHVLNSYVGVSRSRREDGSLHIGVLRIATANILVMGDLEEMPIIVSNGTDMSLV